MKRNCVKFLNGKKNWVNLNCDLFLWFYMNFVCFLWLLFFFLNWLSYIWILFNSLNVKNICVVFSLLWLIWLVYWVIFFFWVNWKRVKLVMYFFWLVCWNCLKSLLMMCMFFWKKNKVWFGILRAWMRKWWLIKKFLKILCLIFCWMLLNILILVWLCGWWLGLNRVFLKFGCRMRVLVFWRVIKNICLVVFFGLIMLLIYRVLGWAWILCIVIWSFWVVVLILKV